jgi:poly-beta-hydroxyalkanoate depolymerase
MMRTSRFLRLLLVAFATAGVLAEVTRTFYEDYLAVSDLAADFSIGTVEEVFQTWDLARGVLMFKGGKVNQVYPPVPHVVEVSP